MISIVSRHLPSARAAAALLAIFALGLAVAAPASAQSGDRPARVDAPIGADPSLDIPLGGVADDVGGLPVTETDLQLHGGPRAVGVLACGATVLGTTGSCSTSNCQTFNPTGRLFRNAVASACTPAKACPGVNAGGPFRHDIYQFDVTDCQCITVNLNQGTCTGLQIVHAAAYLGAVTPWAAYPANCQVPGAVQFLGDVGSSVSQPFSFEIPNNASSNILSLVFNQNFVGQNPCSYSATVSCAPAQSLGCLLGGIEDKLDALAADLAAKSCEQIRLLNTPPGQRESCSDVVVANCGTGYSWNSEATGGPNPDCPTGSTP